MKRTIKFTQFFLAAAVLLLSTSVSAQLDHQMIFRVNGPSSVAGDYNFGEPANGAGQWGPTSINTITGDLAWISDNVDSLGCNPATNNLTGNIALVRRGACMFSLKAYHAQQAGAVGCVICNNTPGGGLVGMTGGDSASAVTIPIVFLTYEDCELLHQQVDSGNTTNVSFYVPTIFDARTAYAYNTPQQHIQPISNHSVTVYNTSTGVASNVDVTAKFVDPNGQDTTFTTTVATLNGTTDSTVTFADVYTPSAIGTYNAIFKTSLNPTDSIQLEFMINGDSTFALDNNQFVNNSTLRGVGPSDADYAGPNTQNTTGNTFEYGMGASYLTGLGTSDIATSATFAIENANQYFGKTMLVLLYEAPVNYFAGNETDFSTFNQVGAGFHIITAQDTINPHTLINAPILNASTGAAGVQLQADRQYMLILQHNGDGSVLNAPRTTSTHVQQFLSIDATVYLNGSLYMGGWTGNFMPVIRMHTQSAATSVETTQTLEISEFMIFPNPTDENIHVKLNLKETSENVAVKLFDLNGKEMQSYNYSNVQNEIFQYNVCHLPAGVYLMHVQTDFAQSVRKVIVK